MAADKLGRPGAFGSCSGKSNSYSMKHFFPLLLLATTTAFNFPTELTMPGSPSSCKWSRTTTCLLQAKDNAREPAAEGSGVCSSSRHFSLRNPRGVSERRVRSLRSGFRRRTSIFCRPERSGTGEQTKQYTGRASKASELESTVVGIAGV